MELNYVDGECHIIIPPAGVGGMNIIEALGGKEPPIPPDDELEMVFQDWRAKGKIFIYRCLKEEGRDALTLDAQDIFRYAMKYVMVECKKLAG